MDKILFRGKSDYGWAYGSLHICEVTNHHHIISRESGKDIDEAVEINLVNNDCVEVCPTTIGQYIGRNDTANTPIFTGDIVMDEFERTFSVIFSIHFQQMRLIPVNEKAKTAYVGNYGVEIFSWTHPKMSLTIIGNIHDEVMQNENH